jgi:hypothetical protein
MTSHPHATYFSSKLFLNITVSAKTIAHFPYFDVILCGAIATEWQEVCQFFCFIICIYVLIIKEKRQTVYTVLESSIEMTGKKRKKTKI